MGNVQEAEMFRDKIKAKYETFSFNFRKLADFLLQRELDAAFMTATELAQHMGVDAATVVRFAQTLGYSGFREMIKEVQRIVKAELTASYTATLNAPDDATLFRNLLQNEKHNLELAQARLTEHANTVLPVLLKAKRIWVMGQGSCSHLAALCAASLREIGLPAISIAPDPLESATNLKGVGPDDVVIGFSLTGMDLSVADAVRYARQRGAETLVFSSSPVAAAALAAKTTIICPGPTQTRVPSFTGLTAMIVVLVAAFAARHPERTAAMRAGLEQSYSQLLALQSQSSSEVDVESVWRQF
jgi:DNA-binding MurR/RpiR family transcriptional regulator